MSFEITEFSLGFEKEYINIHNKGFQYSCYSENNWPRKIKGKKQGTEVFLALKDNECVGQTTLENEKNNYIIDSITILKEYRKNGLGSQLLEYAENWLKKKGESEIYLELHGDCSDLFSFYQKRGYKLIDLKYRVETIKENEGKESWKAYPFINRKDLNNIKKERVITDFVVWLIFKKEVV